MYSIIYTLNNSFKNSIRIRGQFWTLIIIIILSVFSFSTIFLSLFFLQWIMQMIVNKNNIVIYPLKIYMGLTAISGLSMYTILLMYVSRLFFLSVLENENDLKIMKLLGDTQKRIIIEYTIQPIYYLLILLPVSAGISFKVAKQFIADFFDISDLQTVIQSFHIPLSLVISMIIICCLYVFISNFFKIRRLLKKWN